MLKKISNWWCKVPKLFRWLTAAIAAIFLASILSFFGLLPLDPSILQLKNSATSLLVSITEIDKKIEYQSKNIEKIIGIDCRKIAEHSWDISKGLIMIDENSISLETEKGWARFRRPIGDLFVFDFIFKLVTPELFDAVVAFKDKNNNEISLSIDTQDIDNNPVLYWINKITGATTIEEKQFFQTRIQQNSEIKLRVETIQKPDHLLASGFLLYTPRGKKGQISIILKDFSLERFYNKEVFLHFSVNNGGQKLKDGILLKIIQCGIDDSKPELQL